ncbi:MAG: hypothetical protein ABW043_17290, partial [Devosia sp.]|uniref:hypothetical protein n=1 Tax=Devosia sp. TaxID=1871048 RepID=UPI00339B999C
RPFVFRSALTHPSSLPGLSRQSIWPSPTPHVIPAKAGISVFGQLHRSLGKQDQKYRPSLPLRGKKFEILSAQLN